jgi:hypothetical protein
MTRQVVSILAGVAWIVALGAGCSDDSSSGPPCPTGQVQVGDKCVPANVDLGPIPDGSTPDGAPPTADATPDTAPGPDGLTPDGLTPDGPVGDTTPTPDAPTGFTGVVFDDDWQAGATFAPFGGSVNDVTRDTTEKQSGTHSIKIVVPTTGYTGGAFVIPTPADLSSYDSVTFWVKASQAGETLNGAGFGDDASGTATYKSEVNAIALTTSWQKVIMPLPLAAKLIAEKGVFYFAEGSTATGYTIWIDDIKYENVGSAVITAAAPAIATVTENLTVGDAPKPIPGPSVAYTINGSTQVSAIGLAYFTFTSSNPAAATVNAAGEIVPVAAGTTEVTASLGATPAAGKVTVNVTAAAAFGGTVFDDDWQGGATFAPFGGSTNDVTRDTAEKQAGTHSIKVVVPTSGYTGGAFALPAPADLSSYDSVTFWVKASKAGETLNGAGFGDDASGTTTYKSEVNAIPLTTSWQKVIMPLPIAAQLTAEKGVFYFAEGSTATGYTIWIDEIKYETVGSTVITNAAPAIATVTENLKVGDAPKPIPGPSVAYTISGSVQVSAIGLAYFTFTSSDTNVATVNAAGEIVAVGAGTTEITASLGATPAAGKVTVNVTASATFNGVVFDDAFQGGATFTTFGGANNAISIDTTEKQAGTSSLKIVVPAGSAGYTGGAYVLPAPTSLTSYNALTFWAKATVAAPFKVGIGNNAATTTLQTEILPTLSTSWTKYTIPLPDAAKLTAEDGVFHFAQGVAPADPGFTVYLDEIKFENVSGVITNARPSIATVTENLIVGDKKGVVGTSAVYAISGTDQTSITVAPAYFSFTSTNATVADVVNGEINAKATGAAEITATLAGAAAAGKITVNVSAASDPTTAAPTPPTRTPADVIALFSNAYSPNVTVDTWSAVWDSADVADVKVVNDDTKKYTNLVFAGVEFTSSTIDATSMTHLHIDIWTPNATVFKLKLVDFGANGIFQGTPNDDTEGQVTYDAASTPPLTTGQWISLDIPLTQFTGLTNRAHLAQMVIDSSTSTVYVDNVYFWK